MDELVSQSGSQDTQCPDGAKERLPEDLPSFAVVDHSQPATLAGIPTAIIDDIRQHSTEPEAISLDAMEVEAALRMDDQSPSPRSSPVICPPVLQTAEGGRTELDMTIDADNENAIGVPANEDDRAELNMNTPVSQSPVIAVQETQVLEAPYYFRLTELKVASTTADASTRVNDDTPQCSAEPEAVSSDATVTEVEAALHSDMAARDPSPTPTPPVTQPSEGNSNEHNMDVDGVTGQPVLEEPAVDDDEESDDMDDASSEVSVGVDLREDLEDALQGDFDFKGSYYHAAVAPTAPNPCLNIEGLGYIGLPLSTRDAQAIIECSAHAPFGHNQRTIVDTKVRDTWEIEPVKVKFDNPAWAQWIQSYVVTTVWQALGVAPASVAPRCEFYKLLLYEVGSHFLPHQDTEKVDGMFATVIVILPSPYTGGEVHVSHSSSPKAIDLAAHSLFSTSVLAWYTDVTHEVKPLQSGYRLALSYNLVHSAPGIPRPTLPDMNTATMRLQHVLHKWHKSAYQQEEMDDNFIAYLLDHQYSEVNLRAGIKTLKGSDAHLVTNLRTVAEELGYMVLLANLEYHVTGSADGDAGYGSYHRRGRYGGWGSSDDEGESTPGMDEIHETTLTLRNLVDLDGNSLVGAKSLGLSDGNLIPKEPFEDATPDDTEYEGYMGNYAGSVEHYYRRTVVVIVHEDDAHGILFSVGGVHYALQRLAKSTSDIPSFDDREMASLVLKSLNATDKTTVGTMSDYALKWKDLDMWKTVIKKSGSLITTFGGEKLIRAWKVFNFDSVLPSFEEILLATTRLGSRIDFIHSLPQHADAEEFEKVQTWAEEQAVRAFSSFNSPMIEDIPVLIAVGRARGAVFLVKQILPQLVKNTSIFVFAVAFVKALHEHRETIPDQPPSPAGTEDPPANNDNMSTLMSQLLNTAVAQWSSVVAQANPVPSYYPYYRQPQAPLVQTQKVQRIIDLVELCLLVKQMAPCNNLFLSILKVQESAPQKFQTLYIPLVPRLRDVMKAKSVDLRSPPFSDFLQLLVGSYLRDVLGAQGRSHRTKLRKIGCGCANCAPVDAFITSKIKATETFRLVQARRLHLEARLSTAPDLLTFVTIRSGSPHGVQVTKRPEIVSAQQWESRVDQAKTFLLSIGDDDDISRLMGRRYADVMKALTGVQQFTLTVADAARKPSGPSSSNSVLVPNAATAIVATASSSSSVVPSNPQQTAGAKRKKPPMVNLGVIDLTGDDSS
ncbi:hypothetical protein DXG01_008273 [Tephrocybe rancida]|nr:hypothetical protein DXG01_008273 [Tephrocybe rancida]